MSTKKTYLILYNTIQTIGWSYLLYMCLPDIQGALFDVKSRLALHDKVGSVLELFQTLALLEVAHSALGIVKSSPFITGLQVCSLVLF